MRTAAFLLMFGIGSTAFGQDMTKYEALVHQADSLYHAKDFLASAQHYSSAFASLGGAGMMDDLYSAARSWALAGVPDSAFNRLTRLANMSDFQSLEMVTYDADLVSLHSDPRWAHVVAEVKANKDVAEANFDRPLMHTLDSIMDQDQQYRRQTDEVEKQYGRDSEEMKALWHAMALADSSDLVLVSKILDERGWLGADIIGQMGNATLFLVIQHADQATQEHYLPMMRAAVAKGNAEPADLALLEDRVALGEGKRQIYGSQIGRDPDTGEFYVSPLEDPDHVDERRAAVGLGPLADYAGIWGIIWDVKAYKADLPALEARERAHKR